VGLGGAEEALHAVGDGARHVSPEPLLAEAVAGHVARLHENRGHPGLTKDRDGQRPPLARDAYALDVPQLDEGELGET
jgi:hypothetical protein